MFDNFVIETRPEADEPEPPVDEETAAEPVSPTEQEENVRPKVRQKRQPNRNSRLNPSRKSNLNRRRKNLFPSRCPGRKSYTQSEVDEMVNTARQEGYEQGFRSSQNGVDAEANTLLMDINQNWPLCCQKPPISEPKLKIRRWKWLRLPCSNWCRP